MSREGKAGGNTGILSGLKVIEHLCASVVIVVKLSSPLGCKDELIHHFGAPKSLTSCNTFLATIQMIIMINLTQRSNRI